MRFYVIIFAVVFISLGSCTKEDRKLLIIQQEAAIDQYVQNLSCDTVLYQNGVVRAILERGKPSYAADTVAEGDTVRFYYAGYIFSNGKGTLFHTNSDSVATANNRTLPEDQALLCSGAIGGGELLKGLDYGFRGMAPGEHAYLVFNTDFGFGNTKVGQVPAMSPLLFEVWFVQVVKKQISLSQ